MEPAFLVLSPSPLGCTPGSAHSTVSGRCWMRSGEGERRNLSYCAGAVSFVLVVAESRFAWAQASYVAPRLKDLAEAGGATCPRLAYSWIARVSFRDGANPVSFAPGVLAPLRGRCISSASSSLRTAATFSNCWTRRLRSADKREKGRTKQETRTSAPCLQQKPARTRHTESVRQSPRCLAGCVHCVVLVFFSGGWVGVPWFSLCRENRNKD